MPTTISDQVHVTRPGKDPRSHTTDNQARYPITYEVESDSEGCSSRQRDGPLKVIDVIEISSDSDEEPPMTRLHHKQPTPSPPPVFPVRKRAPRRRIVESSDEASDTGSDEQEIIELSDSSLERGSIPSKRKALPIPPSRCETNGIQTSIDPSTPDVDPFDESTITFDEPKTARKPVRLGPPSKTNIAKTTQELDIQIETSKGRESPVNPLAPKSTNAPDIQRTPKPKTAAKTTRLHTKKARTEAELLRRQEYAQKIFDDLNKSVFKEGLPASTKLVWNKRLLTTAGKAKFHRNREGVTTTQIELAEKILDCDERIRNTLSHEMCHLATWVIDEKLNEHHGSFFKRWAYLVEKKHPHIEVSVKHNYEISYPFEWKCEKCAKIYGRFSKSIKPEECLCGACREGKLIPQFTVRGKISTPKLSRMAAARPQDSPRVAPSTLASVGALYSDSEEDVIQSLTQTLATTVL